MAGDQPRAVRVALAGSRGSSQRTLEGLSRNGVCVASVFGLAKERAEGVSGYVDLVQVAARLGLPAMAFTDINHPGVVDAVRSLDLDVLMVVGLSQMVRPPLLYMPRRGCVGFHPTCLPRGRGRAPLAWLTLEAVPGAATFFVMDEGPDSGPILVQEPFFVDSNDYAEDVAAKIDRAIDRALDRWLPRLLAGEWQPRPQDDSLATFYGKRTPEDGLIDWQRPACEIYDLVRAAGRPHPGAYTYLNARKIIVWRAQIDNRFRGRGVVGRVVTIGEGGAPVVQTGNGFLKLTEIGIVAGGASKAVPRVGSKLGCVPAEEMDKLYRRVAELEKTVERLSQALDASRESRQMP